jgi:hypothetical protein
MFAEIYSRILVFLYGLVGKTAAPDAPTTAIALPSASAVALPPAPAVALPPAPAVALPPAPAVALPPAPAVAPTGALPPAPAVAPTGALPSASPVAHSGAPTVSAAPDSYHAAEVVDGVYIGNFIAASDPDWIRGNNIATVIDASGIPYKKYAPTISVLIEDKQLGSQDIARYLRTFVALADALRAERQSGKRVLVHCYAGINRSASIIGFYLADCGYGYEEILELLQHANCKRRIQVLTNDTFRGLLRVYCAYIARV